MIRFALVALGWIAAEIAHAIVAVARSVLRWIP